VTYLQHDPHLLAVTPAHFDEQLAALRQHYAVVTLSELRERLANGNRLGPLVVLTFDDGYTDNAETVLPLLEKHGVPATFYLATGFTGTTREYLQDDLERLLLLSPQCPDQLYLTVGGKSFVWMMRLRGAEDVNTASAAGWNMDSRADPTPRHRAHREIHNLLRFCPPGEREQVLEQIRAQCGDPGPARPTHRPISWGQVRNMATRELIELGAHTVNHPWLSALPLEEQRAEILESKRTLEEQTGRCVTSFAYPYGWPKSYTAETVGLLKELGFTNACVGFRQRICRRTDLFQLSRFGVRNWDGNGFLLRLRVAQL